MIYLQLFYLPVLESLEQQFLHFHDQDGQLQEPVMTPYPYQPLLDGGGSLSNQTICNKIPNRCVCVHVCPRRIFSANSKQ